MAAEISCLLPCCYAATSTVTGHWNQIAQAVLPANISTAEAALLFARLNAAVWDASIAGWGVKYNVLFWRPITAIRQGDGNAANAAYVDANWTPTLATPPHPEYPSGEVQPGQPLERVLLRAATPALTVNVVQTAPTRLTEFLL